MCLCLSVNELMGVSDTLTSWVQMGSPDCQVCSGSSYSWLRPLGGGRQRSDLVELLGDRSSWRCVPGGGSGCGRCV